MGRPYDPGLAVNPGPPPEPAPIAICAYRKCKCDEIYPWDDYGYIGNKYMHLDCIIAEHEEQSDTEIAEHEGYTVVRAT